MSEALCLERSFERVGTRPGVALRLPLEGVLVANDALEEVPLRAARGVASTRGASTVRAFVVRSESLSGVGLQRGDYLLVDTVHAAEAEGLLLVEIAGRFTLKHNWSLRVVKEPYEIVGTFAGIIRRRGFAPRRCSVVADQPLEQPRPLSRRGILRSRLSMLESTRASTRNPRLRKALLNEAELVRKQLQSGAAGD